MVYFIDNWRFFNILLGRYRITLSYSIGLVLDKRQDSLPEGKFGACSCVPVKALKSEASLRRGMQLPEEHNLYNEVITVMRKSSIS